MKEYNEQVVETLDDAGCIIANKNIIIDNLQARIAELEEELLKTRLELLTSHGESEELLGRIAELEAENARLKEIEQTNDTLLDQLGDKNAALLDEVASQKHCYAEAVAHYEKQLAAEQLNNKLLRDALEAVIKVHGYESGIPVEAISTQANTEALDKYVAEKVKESHKVIPREGLVPHAYQLEATHNNAEYWYKWGHSKEAAEKGESVICMAQAVFAWRNAAYAKAEEVATLTRQRDLAVEALKERLEYAGIIEERCGSIATDKARAAIKESEGK